MREFCFRRINLADWRGEALVGRRDEARRVSTRRKSADADRGPTKGQTLCVAFYVDPLTSA